MYVSKAEILLLGGDQLDLVLNGCLSLGGRILSFTVVRSFLAKLVKSLATSIVSGGIGVGTKVIPSASVEYTSLEKTYSVRL